MNSKSLIFLGGVFVILLAALFLVKPKRPTVGNLADVGKELVADFKVEAARTVKLVKGEQEIRLAKKGNQWVVASKDDRPADEGRVTGLLNALHDAKVKEDRVGPEDTFDLDEKHRLTIDVADAEDKSLAAVVAGKSPDWGTTFVLDGNPPKILLVDQNIGEKAQVVTDDEKKVLSVDKWYDLKLLRVASDDVIDVAFQKGDQKWRIQKVIPGEGPVKPQPKEAVKKDEGKKEEPKADEKKDAPKAEGGDATKDEKKADEKDAKKDEAKPEEKKDEKAEEKKEEKKPVWRITEPEDAEADESACSSVCSAVSWLDAKGYADEVKPEEQGFDKPTVITKLVLKDGTTHTLVFGKFVKDAKNDYDSYAVAKLDDQPQVWKIGKTEFENLTKPLDKLKKAKEEPKAEEKKDDGQAPKAEEKKDEPKAEEKKEEAKVEPAKKEDEKKADEPKKE